MANSESAQPAPATISPAASAVEKVAQALKQENVGRDTLWQAAYMLRNYATELRTSSEPTPDVIRDAERYQWLRANCVREWVSVMPDKAQAPTLDIGFTAPGHDLDAAIDAAIREQATDYLRDGLDLAFSSEWEAQGRAEQQSGEKDNG